ncbi:hypothetical protein U1Q18_028020 [Sarracenia purpurea var. burkii]
MPSKVAVHLDRPETPSRKDQPQHSVTSPTKSSSKAIDFQRNHWQEYPRHRPQKIGEPSTQSRASRPKSPETGLKKRKGEEKGRRKEAKSDKTPSRRRRS